MALEEIAEGIRKGLTGKSFEGTLKFDCGADGVVVLAEGTADTQDRENRLHNRHQSGKPDKTAHR